MNAKLTPKQQCRIFAAMKSPFQILFVFCFLLLTARVDAQEEMGREGESSASWSMIGFDRTWVPQNNGFPNGGFGFTGFGAIDLDRIFWIGGGLRGTGVGKRDALAITVGPGFQILGTSRLGLFGYIQGGFCISSNNALTGFSFFTDTSTSWGFTAIGSVGASAEIFSNVKIYLATIGTYFSNEHGATPYGLQLGLTLGGK